MGSEPSLKKKLKEVIDDRGERKLRLEVDLLKEYCALTGYDYPLYQTRNLVPLGFLMTLTAPVFSEIILSFIAAFPNVIKGVIHTSSKVAIFSPLTLSSKYYHEKLEMRNVKEKVGRKGKYLVVDLELVLMNENDVTVASDLHQFFLKM
jgi:hypothetical protein